MVTVLLTFYIQDVLKLKKNNSGAKRLIILRCGELEWPRVRDSLAYAPGVSVFLFFPALSHCGFESMWVAALNEDGQYRPKHVVVHYIVIKYTSCDTIVFDYLPFSKFHTHNGDDTIPRIPSVTEIFQILSIIQ